MARISTSLWLVAFLLLASGLATGLLAMINIARTSHASDVHRDDVGHAHNVLVNAGAYDFDKAASALGIPAYTGGSSTDRTEFERNVGSRTFLFLTDSVADRIEAEWARTAMQFAVVAGACILTAGVVGWQAVRARRLERAAQPSR